MEDLDLNNENDASSWKEETEKVSLKRRSFDFRVALQFPTRKSAEKKAHDKNVSKSCLADSKRTPSVTQMKNNKTWEKTDQENSSESEEDVKEASDENSSALLKRAMNIKENKAVVSGSRKQHHCMLNRKV